MLAEVLLQAALVVASGAVAFQLGEWVLVQIRRRSLKLNQGDRHHHLAVVREELWMIAIHSLVFSASCLVLKQKHSWLKPREVQAWILEVSIWACLPL
mmetsp:Transcript_60995/g.163771  ORF Transcript_60995/g.163771 Transcript_60995/m.163771 type:complete len:98 (-) Transcript_60995:269-562(-)